METREISRQQWKSTFDSLSRIYDGSNASLEILDGARGAQMEIEDQPLRGISYDTTGIELVFSTRDGGHLAHRIANPERVQIEEGDDGLIAAIGIVSAGEPQTILRLSSPVASKLLPRATD
jgi:uncharacterized protein DUF5335